MSGTYSLTATYNGDANYNTTSDNFHISIENTNGDGRLTSAIAATVTGSILPTTTVTISGTVTGQSGNAAPTGIIDVYSSGNYLTGVSLASATSGVSVPFTITLTSQELFQGANELTLQYLGDTNYNSSATVLSTPISNPLSDFVLSSSGAIIVVPNAGDPATVVLTVTPVNGYSGTIAFSTGGNLAPGPQLPASITIPPTGVSETFDVVLTSVAALGSGEFFGNLIATDSVSHITHTLGLELAVANPASTTPGFSLSNSGAITILQGATTGDTSTISITPTDGFIGMVNLSCSVTSSPASAISPVTCAMPASVNITGTIWVEAWPAPVVARYLPFCRSWEFQHATVDGGRCLACLYCCRLSAAWQPAAVEAVGAEAVVVVEAPGQLRAPIHLP